MKVLSSIQFSKAFFVHPTGNGYLTFFRAGEGKGGGEEERCLTSTKPSSAQVDSLKAMSPTDL